MSAPLIETLVARIKEVHKQFAEALDLISDAQLEAARPPGGRSGKDLLAHLMFWDHRLLHALAPGEGSPALRRAPPLIADITYDDRWADAVNERIFHLNRGRDSATIKAEFARTCDALTQAVAALTEHEVVDPSGLSARLGEPFLPMLTGAYEHYEDHLADLKLAAGH